MTNCVLSSTIYVGRPDLIELNEAVEHEEIDAALASAAETATQITILGGFYSLLPLIALFEAVPKKRRPICRVRVAVGLESTSLIPKTWIDMSRLRDALLKLKFRNPEVAIVDSAPVHFHTKLFHFLNTTRPVWFVGSANPGSGRHELMVRIPGRHKALSEYVTAVFAKAVNVERPPPRASVTSLRDFFLSGMLCHRPPVQRLFTFDAFQFDPSDRELLSTAFAGSSGVDHASPKAQGFGFDLRSALRLAESRSEAAPQGRTHFRPYSIDSVFGWWMPRVYADDIRKDVREDEQERAERLREIGAAMRAPAGVSAARQALRDHVVSMRAFLETHGIDARPAKDREQRFEKFFASRSKMLGDEDSVRRHARSLILTDMPDIWADGSAVENFEQSFFDDLAYRAARNPQPRVVRSLLEWLDEEASTTGEDFQDAMVSRLAEEPWTDDCWL